MPLGLSVWLSPSYQLTFGITVGKAEVGFTAATNRQQPGVVAKRRVVVVVVDQLLDEVAFVRVAFQVQLVNL